MQPGTVRCWVTAPQLEWLTSTPALLHGLALTSCLLVFTCYKLLPLPNAY